VIERDLARINALYEEARKGLSEVAPRFCTATSSCERDLEVGTNGNHSSYLSFQGSVYVDFEWDKAAPHGRFDGLSTAVVSATTSEVSTSRINSQGQRRQELLYDIYHACSFLDFELEPASIIPIVFTMS